MPWRSEFYEKVSLKGVSDVTSFGKVGLKAVYFLDAGTLGKVGPKGKFPPGRRSPRKGCIRNELPFEIAFQSN